MLARRIVILLVSGLLLGGRTALASTAPCKPVPMEEAVHIGHRFATQWRPNVELLRLDTAHPPREWEESPTPPGLDGGRCVWNVEFKDTHTHAFILFRIASGRVTDVKKDAGVRTSKGLPVQAFKVTGKQLVTAAREAGILPAKPPGTAGYSFYLLHRGYDQYEVQVVGEDAGGQHVSIFVDPRTGKVKHQPGAAQ